MLFLAGLPLWASCEKDSDESGRYVECGPGCLSDKLESNVLFMRDAVMAFVGNDTLLSARLEYLSGVEKSLIVRFSDGHTAVFDNLNAYPDFRCPRVGIMHDDEGFFWMINDEVLCDSNNLPLRVTDGESYPHFLLDESQWFFSTDGLSWQVVDSTSLDSWSSSVTCSHNCDFVWCNFNRNCQFLFCVRNSAGLLGPAVPNRGFYKDLFIDAGYGLSDRDSLSAAIALGYTVEYLSISDTKDTAMQNRILGGDATDCNGRLLYPDGQPRYRTLYVNGGSSRTHGRSMRKSTLERMRDFVRNGGGYLGICAGSYFVSRGYDTVPDFPHYLQLWPGVMNHSGLKNEYMGMFIDEGSPLLRYDTYGGDHYVDNIRHNAGWWTDDRPVGTEVLARYDFPLLPKIHGKASIMAYRNDKRWGRIVMVGSHPEGAPSGEKLQLTSAVLRYAADGVGPTRLKGLLQNGESRIMDRTADDGDPDYARIGDMQYHHFAVFIPSDARNVHFYVESDVDCTLRLSVSEKSYAYHDVANRSTEDNGSRQELIFEQMREGIWYVSVQCLTTVTVTDAEKYQRYSGRTDVLNGVPYSIRVEWE